MCPSSRVLEAVRATDRAANGHGRAAGSGYADRPPVIDIRERLCVTALDPPKEAVDDRRGRPPVRTVHRRRLLAPGWEPRFRPTAMVALLHTTPVNDHRAARVQDSTTT
jgi:hypothetical protein